MEQIGQHRLQAVHPNWRGFLKFSGDGLSVVHEEPSNKGVYLIKDQKLTVYWEDFDPDIFYRIGDIYVHEQLLSNIPDINSIEFLSLQDHYLRAKKVSVLVPGSDYEVTLRLGTTDIPTFIQVFIWNEYASNFLPEKCNIIIDLGANIGLSTVFFGLKYPDAQIMAVEPEIGNYYALCSNISSLGSRVQPRHAAVWSKNGQINLHTVDEAGVPLGDWGVQTSERDIQTAQPINAYTLGTLLDSAGFATADILKIDIEGAEREIFANGAAEWLPRVNLIIVETHDRFQIGSEDAVRRAVISRFEELPRVGENLFFRRRGS